MPTSTMPQITISTPVPTTSSISQSKSTHQPSDPQPTIPPQQTIAVTDLPSNTTTSNSCHLCATELPSDFSSSTKYPTKFIDTCLLCSRSFCPIHKGQWDQVCNINHAAYCHDHQGQEGVYPSLGEREKAIFMTAPVDEDIQRRIDTFRSLEAEFANENGARPNLVEVKSFIGADIAA